MSRSRHILTRWLALTVVCFVLAGCLPGQKNVVRGVLHGDLIWQGEVYLAGDVVLEDDVRLTILPGTRVRFLSVQENSSGLTEHPNFSGSELIVRGQIYAVGSPEEPITFAAADPDSQAGFWGAINLEGSPEAVFEYCIFRQADSAIHSRDSNVYIEQSLFENNLVGIRFHDSEILIERNLIRNNRTGVRFHFGSPVVCQNQFSDNDVNLFVTSHPRDYNIENNSFGAAAEYQVVLGETVPEDLNMPRNYWPQDDRNATANAFYDGRRTEYLGKVVVEPALVTPSSQVGLSWNP
jgi:hypothetical protein